MAYLIEYERRMVMQCQYCKKEIKDGAKMCKHCGSELVKKETLKDVLLPSKKSGKKRNWKLRIAVCCVFLLGAVLLMVHTSNELIFCEKVDSNLRPVNPAKAFTPGTITVLLRSDSKFETSSIIFTTYNIDGAMEKIIDRSELEVNADWNAVAAPISLYSTGKYKVTATKPNGDLFAEETIEIKG